MEAKTETGIGIHAEITNIVANLSTATMRDAGVGMTTLWTYPDSAKDIIPLPLTRLTSFVMRTHGDNMITCKKAIVTATIEHMGYGVIKAIVTNVIEIIDE